jgi:hypothetical protein
MNRRITSLQTVLSADPQPLAPGWPNIAGHQLALPTLLHDALRTSDPVGAVSTMLQALSPGCGLITGRARSTFGAGRLAYAIDKTIDGNGKTVLAVTLVQGSGRSVQDPGEFTVIGTAVAIATGPLMQAWHGTPAFSTWGGDIVLLGEVDQGQPAPAGTDDYDEQIKLIRPTQAEEHPGYQEFLDGGHHYKADVKAFTYRDNPLGVLWFLLIEGRRALLISPGRAHLQWLAPVIFLARAAGFSFWRVKANGELALYKPVLDGITPRIPQPLVVVHNVHARTLHRPLTVV